MTTGDSNENSKIEASQNQINTDDTPNKAISEEQVSACADSPQAQHSRVKYTTLTVFGVLFWFILFFIIGSLFFHRSDERIKILMELMPTDSQDYGKTIKLNVLDRGLPTNNGYVKLTFEDGETGTFLGSRITKLEALTGAVEVASPRFQNLDFNKDKINIGAYYYGHSQDNKQLSGEAFLYVNDTQPLDRWVIILMYALVTIFLYVQVIVFTSDISILRLRTLIMFMYFATFLSIAAPAGVAFLFHINPDMISVMNKAPIGIVVGKTSELNEPQWLLNIGGSIEKHSLVQEKTKEVEPSRQFQDVTSMGSNSNVIQTATNANHSINAADNLRITGGVVVPFYVVALAMLGAGINMTRKVPEIQKKYYSLSFSDMSRSANNTFLEKTAHFFNPFIGRAIISDKEGAADIKATLIQNYMYLISAPFLAVAVYYLLQILGNNIGKPILVVMAFATGLVSDTIVQGIITFAKNTISNNNHHN